MADWAAYCESPPATAEGNVVPLQAQFPVNSGWKGGIINHN
jgi:hypothetical protein